MKRMINSHMRRLGSNRGAMLLELLIAAFITGIITASVFEFYTSMHDQSEAQQQVTDMQLVSRNSVLEIKKTLRMAGYKLNTLQAPYEFSGDTVTVYMHETQPVDTIRYYLDEFSALEYAGLSQWPKTWKVYRLMKQVNSDTPAIFADYVTGMRVALIDPANAQISVTSVTTMPDYQWTQDNGYRTYSVTDRVMMRNVHI